MVAKRSTFNPQRPPFPTGTHGYDPEDKDMHAIFIAHGPGFKGMKLNNLFKNIDVYNIMTDVMGIASSPNNGSAVVHG
jgi:predicted AlkP superfamily pyrophosphatase or phosphodiesterase